MSGCVHMNPDEFCGSCAPEKLRGALHELSLIEADTQRGITDCSTPVFQRVRNIVEMLRKAEAELARRPARDQLLGWRGIDSDDACQKCDGSGHAREHLPGARNQTLDDPGPCRSCWGTGSISRANGITATITRAGEGARSERDAAGAALCAAMPLVPGAKVKDRTLADLVAQIIVARDEARDAATASARLYASTVEGANRERGEFDRAFQAAAPDWETVRPPEGTPLRAFLLARLVAERDDAKAAEAAVRRQLAGADARYQDALTVLRWTGVCVRDFNGAPEIGTSQGRSRGVPAIAAYERIRADVKPEMGEWSQRP